MEVVGMKERVRAYWDWRASSYDSSPGHVGLPEVWKEALANVFEEKMRILDVGAGTGFIALLLTELGHEVVGVDMSKGMLEVARNKARQKGLQIEFKLGDAENLPFADNSFDAVICRHLLWTLPNPQKAVNEWSRVARKKVVAIDGSWYPKSIPARLRRFIGRLGIAIYEKRKPWRGHYNREINRMLPLRGNLAPEKIVELFRNAGLSASIRDLSRVRRKLLENRPFVYRLAWEDKPYFMVEGFKKV